MRAAGSVSEPARVYDTVVPCGQIRGSIPLYWSQYVDMRYTPRVKLGGSEEGVRG